MQQAPSSLAGYMFSGGLIGFVFGFIAIFLDFDPMASSLGTKALRLLLVGFVVGCILGYLIAPASVKTAKNKGFKDLFIGLLLIAAVVAPVTWFVHWLYTPSIAGSISAPMSVTEAPQSKHVDEYKSMALRVLIEDGYDPVHKMKMEPTLTNNMRSACEKYKCTPLEYVEGARRVLEAIKKRSPESTLTLACNIIGRDSPSLDRAVDSLIAVFSKPEPSEQRLQR